MNLFKISTDAASAARRLRWRRRRSDVDVIKLRMDKPLYIGLASLMRMMKKRRRLTAMMVTKIEIKKDTAKTLVY